MGILESEGVLIAAISLAINMLLVILIAIIWSRFRKAERNFVRMTGGTGIPDLQGVIIDLQDKIKALQHNSKQAEEAIAAIRARLQEIKGNVGIYRYNAFQEQGNDLSFSIAIVDDRLNGIVFTGIHGRDESYMYGKPLENGESAYSLSPEERRAIDLALSKTPLHGAAKASGAGMPR